MTPLAGIAAQQADRPSCPRPKTWELAGQINLDAAGAADARGGRLDRCSIDLSDLSLNTTKLNPGSPLRLRGERLAAKAEGTWRVADGVVQVLQITQATLASSVASAGATDVLVSPERPDESSGRIDWQADLARLAAWSPPSARYATRGRVRGTALIRGVPGRDQREAECRRARADSDRPPAAGRRHAANRLVRTDRQDRRRRDAHAGRDVG